MQQGFVSLSHIAKVERATETSVKHMIRITLKYQTNSVPTMQAIHHQEAVSGSRRTFLSLVPTFAITFTLNNLQESMNNKLSDLMIKM